MGKKDQGSQNIPIPSAEGFKIHVIVSDWNQQITSKLLKGAIDTLSKHGIKENEIEIVHVPGAFELPVAAKILLKERTTDAVICLGCVIKGETEHDMFINQSVANALNQLAVISGKPMIFGVLTTNTEQQALDRSGGEHGHKGIEAAETAIRMVALSKNISKPKSTIGFS